MISTIEGVKTRIIQITIRFSLTILVFSRANSVFLTYVDLRSLRSFSYNSKVESTRLDLNEFDSLSIKDCVMFVIIDSSSPIFQIVLSRMALMMYGTRTMNLKSHHWLFERRQEQKTAKSVD